MKRSLFLFLLAFAFDLSLSAQNNAGAIKNVSAAEFKKEMEQNKTVIIDLRTDDEIAAKGMIKNAIQIDFLSKEAETEILKLDKTKTYLLYCAGGGRSGDAAEIMMKNGFKDVFNLAKGFTDWQKNGFEIVNR
jgi:rhodanese-related sulfurtransferase